VSVVNSPPNSNAETKNTKMGACHRTIPDRPQTMSLNHIYKAFDADKVATAKGLHCFGISQCNLESVALNN
jgi:hypothetical protein